MSDYLDRQLALFEQLITEYELGNLNLNSLVQRIEGVALAIGEDFWSNTVSSLVDPLEEVNALALDEQRSLDLEDKKIIEEALANLKSAISRFRPSK